jgi:hypothetical protein
MKKAKPGDDLRPEYKRSDFGALIRGKYDARIAEGCNAVVLESRLEEAPRFLQRIEASRQSLREGRGVRLEDVEDE